MADHNAAVAGSRELLICFSHLRWNFVYQRPQHLISRFARQYDVMYFEEPVHDSDTARLEVRPAADGLDVLVPHIPAGEDAAFVLKHLLDEHLRAVGREPSVLWYYTPMSVPFSAHLPRQLVVYDCMDELSAFRGAPAQMLAYEKRLLSMADIVFTGGHSLYEAKRSAHPNVHVFPSSVDKEHFSRARSADAGPEPEDQAGIPRPRLGFYGVVDERMDLRLLDSIAQLRPDWHIVLVGPIVKIDPADVPDRPNIHYLGGRQYEDLPSYLRGWDVAIMPFALNESTRYISPTKTPEYLAGGRPVVSTPITDVQRSYGENPAVFIADGPQAFIEAAEAAMRLPGDVVTGHADAALANMSWDRCWSDMHALMQQARSRPSPDQGRSPRALRPHYDVLIVGAGFAGSVMAERLAAGSGKRVLVVDRRPHIAGNAYDHYDDAGILVHKYGPHIFHTNSDAVVEYLSRFTQWRPYEHRVLADVDGKLVPIPINLTTLEALYGGSFTEQEARDFLAARAERIDDIRSSEDVVLSTVGRELYEKFFRGYTTKQWGRDPSALDRSVTARIPTRYNRDDRYFGDSFQSMPLEGYTKMFERMLDHPNIDVQVGCDFATVREQVEFDHLVYTGPLDEYFGFCHGRLPYRSLRFEHQTLDTTQFQPVAVVNYPSADVPYTRITEYRHLTGQAADRSNVSYEYPSAEGDPYYPIPCPESDAMRQRYEAMADAEGNVSFLGRLGTYRYYNMDQVVAQALAEYARLTGTAGIRKALENSTTWRPQRRTA